MRVFNSQKNIGTETTVIGVNSYKDFMEIEGMREGFKAWTRREYDNEVLSYTQMIIVMSFVYKNAYWALFETKRIVKNGKLIRLDSKHSFFPEGYVVLMRIRPDLGVVFESLPDYKFLLVLIEYS